MKKKHHLVPIAALLLLVLNGAVLVAALNQWHNSQDTTETIRLTEFTNSVKLTAALAPISTLDEAKQFANRLIASKNNVQAADHQVLVAVSTTHEETLGALVMVLALAFAVSSMLTAALVPMYRSDSVSSPQ